MTHDVLIVDDSSLIRQMLKKSLRLAGLAVSEVFEAGNGIEALAQLYDHEVSVMLADINMPTMNGIQLLRRMKSHERLRDLPIVIISSEGGQQRIAELEQLGVFGYLRKPFTPEQLRDLLRPVLGVHANDATNDEPDDTGF